MKDDLEYLKAAAHSVLLQAEENPGVGIPVDPDVAEFMGAFRSDEKLIDVIEGAAGTEEEDGE